jgi:hypothetical protein
VVIFGHDHRGPDSSPFVKVERGGRRSFLSGRDARVKIKSCGIYATQLMLLLWIAGTSIDARWRFGLNIDAP